MYGIEINWLAVLIAGIAHMAIGMFWYSPLLFGKKWMSLVGANEDSMTEAKKGMKKAYVWSFIAALVTATVLSLFLGTSDPIGIAQAVTISVIAFIGFIATTTLPDYLFSVVKKPITLYFIQNGYNLVSIIAMAIILALFS